MTPRILPLRALPALRVPLPVCPLLALASLTLTLLTLAPIARGDGPTAGAQATVSLSHYLELQERIRALEEPGNEEPALAELVSQQTTVRVEDGSVQVHTVFEVEVRGDHREPVPLPLTGFAARAVVEPSDGAALHRSKNGLELVPRQPGTYRVEVEGGRALERIPAGQRLTLAASGAPVSSTELDLPVDLDWRSSGAVVVADEISGERRTIRLALPRGREPSIELGRQLDREPIEDALVQTSLVTVLDLDPGGSRRHDIALYEVLRGEISAFELTLPPGLAVDQVGSDEGEVTPVRAEDRLTVHRDRRLTGTGYVALTSTAPGSGSVALAPVRPSVPVRSQYLVLAASVAAEVIPRPADAWVRVDLDDLPATAREDLRSLRPTAAWRRTGDPEDRAADTDLAVTLDPLPPVPVSRAMVSHRETTTLLTREGSLVHQDRFTVRRVMSAFEVQVPAGMRLWSASVDGREVRPVVRGERLAVPLNLQGETEAVVEVVVLETERLPERRAQIGVTLPRVDLPALEHRWSLLLPETHRYRYEEGTLPVASQGAVTGRFGSSRVEIDQGFFEESLSGPRTALLTGRVTSKEEGLPVPGVTVTLVTPDGREGQVAVTDTSGVYRFPPLPAGRYELIAQIDGFSTMSRKLDLRASRSHELDFSLSLGTVSEEIVVSPDVISARLPSQRQFAREAELHQQQVLLEDEFDRLNQGLVGGVRPLPVEIPETGKLLFLAGALPPPEVQVRISVKGR